MKRDQITSALKSRVRKATHKHKIEVPKYVENEKKFVKNNGTRDCKYATDKETNNMAVGFEIMYHGKPTPVEWNWF